MKSVVYFLEEKSQVGNTVLLRKVASSVHSTNQNTTFTYKYLIPRIVYVHKLPVLSRERFEPCLDGGLLPGRLPVLEAGLEFDLEPPGVKVDL